MSFLRRRLGRLLEPVRAWHGRLIYGVATRVPPVGPDGSVTADIACRRCGYNARPAHSPDAESEKRLANPGNARASILAAPFPDRRADRATAAIEHVHARGRRGYTLPADQSLPAGETRLGVLA